MTWLPANTTNGCFKNFFITSCQPSFLTFLPFLTHYLGHSNDNNFRSSGKVDEKYDFIIVGGGTAGCVVANRLSEIENWKVLLLETGDEQPAVTDIPGLSSVLVDSNIAYSYSLQRDPAACKRNPNSCATSRGYVVGGTSSIGATIYSRGNKEDFDGWANQGNPGWSWKEVLPYFKKFEDLRSQIPGGDLQNHGTGGYLSIELRPKEKYSEVLLDSWKELGLKEVDYTSGNQIGTSKIQYTIKNGFRQSSNDAFLRPIRDKRKNLTIRTRTQVTKVIIDPQTKQATGVEYVKVGTKVTKKVLARKEVIISAGTGESPKLLMLSGIGPADDIRDAGIEVIKDLPVGKNFQDHVGVSPYIFTIKDGPKTFDPVDEKINDVIQFTKHGKGPFKVSGGYLDNIVYLQTQLETLPGVPDIQIVYFNTLQVAGGKALYNSLAYRNAFAMYVVLPAPSSRGWLKLNKTDPIYSKPLIYPNLYSASDDLKTMVAGLKLSKNVTQTNAFKKSGLVVVRTPAPGCEEFSSDEEKYFHCAAVNYSSNMFHMVGTCKMGPETNSDAVVNSRLRVHGIKGLRVIDASVMPDRVRGAPSGSTIMIAEKGSDMIKEDWL